MIQLTDDQFEYLIKRIELNTMALAKQLNQLNKEILINDINQRSRQTRTWLRSHFDTLDALSLNSSQLAQEVSSWAITQ